MKRLMMFAVVVVVAVAGAVTLSICRLATAQDKPPQFTFADDTIPPPDTDTLFAVPQPFASAPALAPEVDEKQQLQQRFVALATQRAAKMTVAELQAAIDVAERDERELTARRKLDEVKYILADIIGTHPESAAAAAAERAKTALDADDRAGSRSRGTTRDQGFGREVAPPLNDRFDGFDRSNDLTPPTNRKS